MKIAYLTADFGVPVLGTKGASVHVRHIANALTGLGHELLLLTPDLEREPNTTVDFPIYEIPLQGTWSSIYDSLKREEICQGNRLVKDLRNLFYSMWLQVNAKPILDQFQPDIIYERYSLFGTGGLQLANFYEIPLILEVNAPLIEEHTKQRGITLPEVAQETQEQIFRGADHIIVVSEWLQKYVSDYKTEVTVLPNAADPELFSPQSGSEIREQLGWDNCYIIGYVGAMKSWHGLDSLLNTLTLLLQNNSRSRLLLVGDGPERKALEKQICEQKLQSFVHITGRIPHHKVPEWVAAMDVAVAPYSASSDHYFSPVKLFEYMSMEKPVIAGRIHQTKELIDHGKTGWVYTPGDVNELSTLIKFLFEDQDIATRVGKAARQQVLTSHTWKNNGKQVENIANNLMYEKKNVGEMCLSKI